MSDTKPPRFERSRKLRSEAHQRIPGGCHTYAKGDDQYPEASPGFIERGAGCHVWDVDGNEFIEYGMGNKSITLGHAYPAVIAAAARELQRGSNFTRPSPIELECAKTFLKLIPGAEMVKFAKDGSDATTAAVRLARACTARELVAVCSDHPLFAVDDWFIGTTAMSAGVPKAVRDLTLTFKYNDLESARALFETHPGRIAAVILEPAKYDEPQDRFLHRLLDLCHDEGALFILDEMITGFRWSNAGGQGLYGLVPDLSTFGKGMANGFSVSALAGKREFLERGGIDHGHERVFLLSTTHGGETHALAAAIATMATFAREPVIETLELRGSQLARGLRQVITRHGLEGYVEVLGRPGCLVYGTRDAQRQPSQAFRALFMQEMIRRGILGPSFIVSFSHTEEDIDKTVHAIDQVCRVYALALSDGIERHLIGGPTQPVFRRFS